MPQQAAMAAEAQEIIVELEPQPKQRQLTHAELICHVGELLRTVRWNGSEERRTPNYPVIAGMLGWTVPELEKFRAENRELLEMDAELAMAAVPPVNPPTDASLIQDEAADVPDETPSDMEVALAIAQADAKLERGLMALGLKEKEVEIAKALQQFNAGHFRESMNIATTTLMRMDVKCVMEQDEIIDRLKEVREAIRKLGDDKYTEERELWAKEERMLMQQLVEMGHLSVKVHETFYRGAAQLALIRMRGKAPGSRELGKPGFRPQVA